MAGDGWLEYFYAVVSEHGVERKGSLLPLIIIHHSDIMYIASLKSYFLYYLYTLATTSFVSLLSRFPLGIPTEQNYYAQKGEKNTTIQR